MSNKIPTSRWLALLVLLSVLLLISALAVAYSGHLNRQTFIALKKAIAMQTELQVTYGKLLLEKSAWTSPAIIQAKAEQELAMRAPSASEVVFVAGPSLSEYRQLQLAESGTRDRLPAEVQP